jgi:hypothetical protein
MAETVQNGAASAPTETGGTPGFIGGFAPGSLPAIDATIAQMETPEPEAPKTEAAPAEEKVRLADTIRAMREARQAKEQEAARAKDWESKYSDLQAEVERMKRDNDFESDPVAYARARGWDKEKQAFMGQMLLYDLVPDKAPPDLRFRLFEMKQADAKRREEEERKAKEEEQSRSQQAETFNEFVGTVSQAVQSFEPGSYPESEAWFIDPNTGETDHDNYLRSLVATAVNMAQTAQRENKVADLSPAAIAKSLEAEVARRMAKRDEKRQAKAKVAVPAQSAGTNSAVQQVLPSPSGRATGGVQPTESTKGTYGSGTPRQPAMSDEERIARAAAVAFRTPGSR